MLHWLKRLVAYDTTSSKSNLELIEAVREWLHEQQLTTNIIFNAAKTKANLLASLPAANGKQHGGIMFSGHTDVVPATTQGWNTNPFTATHIGDRIFGRGTSDMKGFLAVLLALMPEFKKLQLTAPLHFAFSFDEEVGCQGAPLLVHAIKQLNIKPELCLIGEPTNMNFITAHKGFQSFHCSVQGLAKHSSLTPSGCNAIDYAAKIICYLQDYANKLQTYGLRDTDYDVPFTTLSTTIINGGVVHNVIPDKCEFIFEFRNLPDDNPELIIADIKMYIAKLQREMSQQYAGAKISLEKTSAIPSFNSSLDVMTSALAHLASKNHAMRKVAYATEAGYFEQANIKTIICGPGSIEQAHQTNEFITLDQLEQCADFLRKTVTTIIS